jgi:hypothetical protein
MRRGAERSTTVSTIARAIEAAREGPLPGREAAMVNAVLRAAGAIARSNCSGLATSIRDFFPKGTDFSTISSAEVAKVERLLNARPRKSLGFRSPQEVFHSLAYS